MTDSSFEAAFPGLFLKAFRLAWRVLGNRAAAEDVAAEALARACVDWRSVGQLPHRDAWILRVATNLALDVARRKPPRPDTQDPIDVEETATLRVALGEALRTLPRRQREAVALRHLAGLSESEVAEAMGLSLGTVKTHLTRGKTALRDLLGAFREAGDDAVS